MTRRSGTADAKQTELKQALDESEKKSARGGGGGGARARKCRTEANCRCQSQRGIEAGAISTKQEEGTVQSARETAHRSGTANARQKELKQALDESEKKAMRARTPKCSQKQTDAGQKNEDRRSTKAKRGRLRSSAENAEQKQTADAKQTELKQTLDKSEARSEALARVPLPPLAKMMSRPALLRASAKLPHKANCRCQADGVEAGAR